MQTVTINRRTYEILEESKPYFLGRWFGRDVNGIPHTVTATSGAQAYFLTEGAGSVTVRFTNPSCRGEMCYAYTVDGGIPVRCPISQTVIPLPSNDRHAVCLITDELPDGEGKWFEEVIFALESVTPSEGGQLWGIKPCVPIVFFYGDSITEGVHVITDEDHALRNSATYAYPWVCARELGVIPYYIGYGGSGYLRTGWFQTMEVAMDWLSCSHRVDESPYADQRPDLIIINHGTNDMDYSMMEFLSAMQSTMSLLYRRYPDVPVVYVIPLQQTHAAIIRRIMSEYPNGYIIESDSWPMSFTDGIHPNAAGAYRMGKRVAEEIRKLKLL